LPSRGVSNASRSHSGRYTFADDIAAAMIAGIATDLDLLADKRQDPNQCERLDSWRAIGTNATFASSCTL